MVIEEKKIEDLIPYVNNPRINDAAVNAVASSIAEFGFKVPCVIDRNNVIVTGHTRLLAAKKLGLKAVPCILADDLSESQIKAFRLADNKVAELSSWDEDLLKAELEQLKDLDFEMANFGFDLDELNSLEDVVEDDVPEIDEEKEPTTQKGQIYKLGNHRLMCGDSTSIDDVAKLTDGQLIDLLLTDPPYNVAYEGGTKDHLTILNDSMSSENFLEFLTNVNKAADSVMKNGASFYIWHSDSEGINFRKSVIAVSWLQKQLLIWVKNAMVLGRQDYQNRHEPCLYGWKAGAGHYFCEKRNETTVFEDQINLNKLDKNQLKELCAKLLEPKVETTIIKEDKPLKNDIHPTMKPVKLFSRLIINSSRPGDHVLDLFGGSGTTLIACEQLNRKAYLMELDPRYCDAIIQRWEQLTGQKAELVE